MTLLLSFGEQGGSVSLSLNLVVIAWLRLSEILNPPRVQTAVRLFMIRVIGAVATMMVNTARIEMESFKLLKSQSAASTISGFWRIPSLLSLFQSPLL